MAKRRAALHPPPMSEPSIDLSYVAKLARLPLTEEEEKSFGGQLAEIMTHIEKLQEVDVEGIEPMAHVSSTVNRVREDIVCDGLAQDGILKNAPESSKGQLKVPKVVDA